MRRPPRLAIIAALVAILAGLFVVFGGGKERNAVCRETTGDGICVDQPMKVAT